MTNATAMIAASEIARLFEVSMHGHRARLERVKGTPDRRASYRQLLVTVGVRRQRLELAI